MITKERREELSELVNQPFQCDRCGADIRCFACQGIFDLLDALDEAVAANAPAYLAYSCARGRAELLERKLALALNALSAFETEWRGVTIAISTINNLK